MNEITDYELVYMIRQQNEEAYKLMYQRYLPLLWQRCHEFSDRFHHTISAEDLISDCLIVFNQTIYSYRFDQQAAYGTYLYNAVEYRLRTLLRGFDDELNASILSFEEHELFINMIEDTTHRYDPVNQLNCLTIKDLVEELLEECSYNDRIIMRELLAGYREIDVIRKWNISRRRVEYARKKFQKRFSKMLYLNEQNGL